MIAETLHTDRLTLRRPEAGDLPVYTAYCASERSRFTGGPFAASKAFEKLAAMAGHWELRGYGRYVMVHDGQPLGHVGPLQFGDTDAPEMTWTLWTGVAEGQGFATEAARHVAHHLLVENGWPRLGILILPDNRASMGIATRLGARRTDAPAPDWYPEATTWHLTAADLAGGADDSPEGAA